MSLVCISHTFLIGRVFVGVYCDWQLALVFILAQRETWMLSTADWCTNRCYKPLILTYMDLLNDMHQLLYELRSERIRNCKLFNIYLSVSTSMAVHGTRQCVGFWWLLLLWNTDFSKPVNVLWIWGGFSDFWISQVLCHAGLTSSSISPNSIHKPPPVRKPPPLLQNLALNNGGVFGWSENENYAKYVTGPQKFSPAALIRV